MSINQKMAADVLVIGGGLSGLWAAIRAAERGADVLIVDKGFVGAAGVSVFAGGVVLANSPDDPEMAPFLEEHIRENEGLVDREWVLWTVAENHKRIRQWLELGAPVDRNEDGSIRKKMILVASREHVWRVSYDSVALMRFMRGMAARRRVKFLDDTTIIELLKSKDGKVCGAFGIRRQHEELVTIQAKAVVVAAGGHSWKGAAFGHDMVQGEGYYLAASVGADLMSMEFSNAFIPTLTKFRTNGQDVLAGLGGRLINERGDAFLKQRAGKDPAPIHRVARAMAEEMRQGSRIFYDLTHVSGENRETWAEEFYLIRKLCEKSGIDLFASPTEWMPGFAGTISASAGIRLLDFSCQTTVEGLYAAGDAACRTPVFGAGSGITFLNIAWANASGYAAGESAAEYAAKQPLRDPGFPESIVKIDETLTMSGENITAMQKRLKDIVSNHSVNIFRTRERMLAALEELERMDVTERLLAAGTWHDLVKCNELRSSLFVTKAAFHSALCREESRGWHQREDFPSRDDEKWNKYIVIDKDFRIKTIDLGVPVT